MRHLAREASGLVAGVVLAGLAACGGGGGGGNAPAAQNPPPVVPPASAPIVPALSSTLTPASATVEANDGNPAKFSFTVAVSATPSGSVVPVVGADGLVVAVDGSVDTSVANQYTVHLATLPTVDAGTYRGEVLFSLCSDATCSSVHAGTQQRFTYTATVTQGEWSTFQRDAAHSGFVNVQFDPARFSRIWTWSRPAGDPEPLGGINAVATGAGSVFVSKDVYFGQGAVYALDETTGALKWTYALGEMASAGPAAFSAGTVYVPSTDPSSACVVWAIDAVSGMYKFKMPAGCQWSNFFAPTVKSNSVLHTSQTGTVHSFSTADGSPKWSAPARANDQTTPAADSRYAYQYGSNLSGAALNVYDLATGAPVASITDPFSSGFGYYSIFSAPMLGSTGNAIVFSGGGFSGRAASSSEQYEERVLVSYDVGRKAVAWRSANAYITHPAIANGVVYAARNTPPMLDALSETDGRILWSWPLPAGNSAFHRNVVVTRNLVFVSTDLNVYAVDLNTRRQVWSYPQPGMLAISGKNVLYIATGATLSDGNLVAIRLK
jgi:outer membrane protein assembly factor BamB